MWFSALLKLLAPFANPLAKLWSNKIEADNSPEGIEKRNREEIAKNIIKGDSAAESVRVDDLLRSLNDQDRPK